MWKPLCCTALLAGAALAAAPVRAGGPIDAIELSSASAAPDDPNVMLAPLVPGRFDSRCIPMPFSLNTTRDPLPNPLGPGKVSLREARAALEAAMKTWSAVPTSFVSMQLSGTTANRGRPRLDFINEISFTENSGLPPGAIAATIPRTLDRRTEFRAGADLDGDRDPDVAAGITQCQDVDGDGDIEFPAGTYEAGTIFEADLVFNTGGFRFTTADRDVDDVQRSVDLRSVATHELGHAQGLAHSVINQVSDRDGRGSTMFPSVALNDPQDELSARTLDADSIAATTQLYPEGSASSGPGALQGGDVAVSARFGEITGSVRTPEGNPVVGANVFCRDASSGAITGSTYSGAARVRLSQNRQRMLMPLRAESVANGEFRLLLPAGRHECGVEAVDGAPVRLTGANVISMTAQIGEQLGQTAFPEELFDGQTESSLETAPGSAVPLNLIPGGKLVVDFTTNAGMAIDGFDARRDAVGFARAAGGTIVAIVVPGSTLLAMDQAAKTSLGPTAVLALQRAEFRTRPPLPSVVPVFASASVNRCTRTVPPPMMSAPTMAPEMAPAMPAGMTPAGMTPARMTPGMTPAPMMMPGMMMPMPATPAPQPRLQVDVANPLRSRENFVAQDADFSPFYLDDSVGLGRDVIAGLQAGAFGDVCLLLRFPPTADMARGPTVGLDPSSVARKNLSFISSDGGQTFTPMGGNLQFSLGVTPVVR